MSHSHHFPNDVNPFDDKARNARIAEILAELTSSTVTAARSQELRAELQRMSDPLPSIIP